MSSGNYETQILDTIQMLVDNAVSKANFDRTIQGTISRCVDATIGKYIVKYQNSSFYAYSYNTDVAYPAGTSVYVLVPENDMSNEKSIVGTVDKLGPDYVSIIEGENGYEVTGINTINSDAIFELCSYNEKDVKILYDRDNNVDLINLDTFGFENYLKKSNAIICGATFKTSLPTEQQFRGDYGVVFNLDFMDNATGETVTKSYMVNVDQMTGNPYTYTTNSRQYGIFDVDGENFISVKQIYIFEYDFPNTEENKPNDIFVSKLELSAANALDATEAATCALTFITPQGTYFDDNDLDSDIRTLQAQIRIKGNAIDNNSQLVKYYWFVENNNITTKSEKYNQYGGAGWECLNNRNIIQAATEDTEAIVQWVSGTYEYKTEKRNNVAKETNYKCVAVYSNDTVLSRTITIYNYSSDYEITIVSDEGNAFFYDLGHPTLTCYVNGEEAIAADYTYVWSETNSSNQFSMLAETAEDNIEYNAAVNSRNILMEQIAAEQILSGQAQEELNILDRVLAQYENVMRVEGNKIHNLKISAITTFSTYKCSVYKNGIFIGTASIIITNSLKNESVYTLVINNGNQVFKYNEAGIAPTNPALENPVTILPLSFTLYDNKGQKVNYNAIGGKNVFWSVPNRNSLINISTIHGNPITSTNITDTYTEYEELNFDIDTKYDFNRDNNEIQLTVHYKDKILTAKTNFTFTKEGEVGTNGTDFICKIIPFVKDGGIASLYPTVTYNEYNNTYSLNYTTTDDQWFQVQLWHDGERIFEGTQSGLTDENETATVKWSILKNNYGNGIEDTSNLTIDENTGAITFNPDWDMDSSPANIVKCTITYKGVDYYATMPIIYTSVINSDYTIDLAERTGFRNVLYTADGQSPSYDNANPFELIVTQSINGIKENISQLELSEYAVNYDWSVWGAVYFKEWQSSLNLIEKTLFSSREKRNQKYFEPVDTFDGLCVSNAVFCTITQGEQIIGTIHIPIHFYLNRHGNAAMNGWDGNSISIDEDNSGVILAPQVGAGQKNEDNTFTGIFMGTIKEAGAEEVETGLFGYNSGERTIALSAYDGSAKFGKQGAGQIVIDPSTNEALLTSGNYDEEAGTGMIINLSEPSIKFGSGNFEVDKDGHVVAVGFATAKDLSDTKDEIQQEIEKVEETIKAFIVETDFTSFSFACNTEQYPVLNDSFNVYYSATYKNNIVSTDKLNIVMKNDAVTGITADISQKGLITFSVDSTVQIPNITNTFTFDISYTNIEGITFTETKSVYIGLNIQGKDGVQGEQGPAGESGAAGKSAYQIAVEEGFEGTEEEWLISLIGKDGEDGKPGEPGENGKTSYIHIAYANSEDGKTDFSTIDSTGKLYIGQYTDFIEADSEDYTKYNWTLIKGETGEQGPQGETGEKGETGIGIKEIVEQYNLSNSNETYYEDNWVETQPEWQEGYYFWTRSKVIYTDDTIKYTTAILAEALNNANSVANTANTNASNAVDTANTANENAAAATETANNASSKADTALENSNATSQDLASLTKVVEENYDNLQGQIDGAIATWFDNYEPTLENAPANTWSDEEKEQHLGDLFYIVDNEEKAGQCFRFAKINDIYQWIIVEDVEVAKAIADAANAQATADGKATIYTGTAIPTNPQSGDLWMKSANDAILTYVDGQWVEYNNYTDDTAANEAKDLANEANSTANTAKETADSASQTATNAHNEVQKTVKQVDVEYYVSTAEDKLEGGEWKTDEPTWVAGTFIWSRQKMTLVDGTVEYSNPARITGAQGEVGNGIKSTEVTYQASENGTTAPTGEWLEDIPEVNEGFYLWTRTVITYTDDTTTESYSVSRIGTNGTSITINSTEITYQVGDSGTTEPTGAWSNAIPEVPDEKFLWTKTEVIYSDGTKTTSYSVSYKSKNGDPGEIGPAGPSAKLVTISATSQVFKSNTGKNGTFYPENITLISDVQGLEDISVSWEYSIDGITWNSVENIEGITIDNDLYTLNIERDTILFTDDNSVITFKCIASDSTTYSTISITKIYDVVDMTIGARNYALETATSTLIEPNATIYYSDFYELVEPLNNFIGQYITISAEFKIEFSDGASKIDADDTFAFFSKGESGTTNSEDDTVVVDDEEQLFYQTLGCPGYLLSNLKEDYFIKKSFTLLITEDSFVYNPVSIGLEIKTASVLSGVKILMQKLKVETGQVATDWIMALEDLEEETRIEYAVTQNYGDTISETDWKRTYSELEDTTSKWIWQRTAIYKRNILISASEKACIGKPEKAIINTENAYYVHTDADLLPEGLEETAWQTTKPIWTADDKNKYLWIKTTYIYSDNTKSIATPYCDLTWSELGVLDSNLESYKDDFTNQLTGGVVKMEGGEIRIYDNANTEEATKCIVMNSSGIGYLFKDEEGKWPEDGQVISVWGINGTFDARLLTVINLTADQINNGVLRLGGPITLTPKNEEDEIYTTLEEFIADGHEKGEIGDAYKVGDNFYVWDSANETWMLRESGYLIVSDLNNNDIAKISADGLEVLADDDSSVHIFAENDNSDGKYGLCLKDTNQQIIAYTDTTKSTWNVKKQVIEESLTFAPSIQIMQIKNIQNGVVVNHGIGFASILNND